MTKVINMMTEETTGSNESTETTVRRTKRRRPAAKASNARSGTKIDAARKVFLKLAPNHARKDVIRAMSEKVDLSPATASSYFQKLVQETKIKRKNVPRATYERKNGKPTKMTKARELFKQFGHKLERKDMLKILQKQAKLSVAGSATYYESLRKEAA